MKGKINQSIIKSLHPFIKKTKNHLFDEDYDFWKDKDISDFTAIFMAGIIQNNKLIKKIKNHLYLHHHSEKEINEFIYFFLKLDYKIENGVWSWNEADEYDIDFDKIKKTTTKYDLK